MGRLPSFLTASLEDFFDCDLRSIRIRSGAPLPRGVLATASGSEIRFAPRAYRPDTVAGVRLVAHEVVHLLQQGSSRTRLPDADQEHEADALAGAYVRFAAGGGRRMLPRRKRIVAEAGVVQPFIVNFSTMFGKGETVKHSITVNDALRLEQIYNDNSKDWDMITDFTKEMKTSEVLVLNAHGSAKSLDKSTASSFVQFLKMKSFAGCTEVHIYACNCGQGMDSFGQQLTDALYDSYAQIIPVFAPIGSMWWDDDQKRFVIEDTLSKGVFGKDSGWIKCTPRVKSTGYGSNDTYTTGLTVTPKKKGCFFSVVALAQGLPDRCFELESLRALRGSYVRRLPWGASEERSYVRTSDALIAAIAARPDAERVYRQVYASWLAPLARIDDSRAAFAFYKDAMSVLTATLLRGERRTLSSSGGTS